MRVLIDLIASKDQTIEKMQYHKLQGFVYKNLINKSPFSELHDLKTYKYYCYSNIFPPSSALKGERRFLVFSSPNKYLVDSIFSTIGQFIEKGTTINIGDMSFLPSSARILKKNISFANRSLVVTSTPITLRLPEKCYSQYYIPNTLQKSKFIYWRSNLSSSILIKLLEDNIKKKYESFFDIKLDNDLSFIDEFELLKETIIHLPVSNSTIKIPASFWKFQFDTSNRQTKNIFNFILDCGLGERNSYGFGFLNILKNTDGYHVEREVHIQK